MNEHHVLLLSILRDERSVYVAVYGHTEDREAFSIVPIQAALFEIVRIRPRDLLAGLESREYHIGTRAQAAVEGVIIDERVSRFRI